MSQSGPSVKTLLIVYHSQGGGTERLSRAIEEGASRVEGVSVRRLRAVDADSKDILESGCIVFCTPEYFGYMAGAIKDLFDRTYETVRERVVGVSYALVVCAGNDGTGALTSVERIIAGLNLRRVQEPIICRGGVTDEITAECRTLGQTLAAGLEFGIY